MPDMYTSPHNIQDVPRLYATHNQYPYQRRFHASIIPFQEPSAVGIVYIYIYICDFKQISDHIYSTQVAKMSCGNKSLNDGLLLN